MRAIIILNNILNIDKNILNDSFIIGADKGAINAINQGIKLDLALGDFDSVTKDEYEIIKNNSKKIINLDPIKDVTDTNYAINLVKDYEEIILLGGIKGKRIEHFLSNLIDLYNYPNLKIMDDNSLILIMDKSFKPLDNYKFISLYSLSNDTIISLSGFKYNLDNYNLKTNDSLGVSNEIINDAFVEIKQGKILVIYSKDDK